MNEYIVMAAMILLLLFFPVQYVREQQNHHDLLTAEQLVDLAAQKAATDGYFTPTDIANLRNTLAKKLNLAPEAISITATTTPKYRLDQFDRREMIDYDVKLPVRPVLAFAGWLGISASANRFTPEFSGAVASQVPMP